MGGGRRIRDEGIGGMTRIDEIYQLIRDSDRTEVFIHLRPSTIRKPSTARRWLPKVRSRI
jgi:hypothetical protein